MVRRRHPWLLRFVSALVGVTVLLAALELTFWILPVREEAPRVAPTASDRMARFLPNEQRRYSAGWDFYIVNDMRTNNAGWWSDIDYVRTADAPLVAVLGDSYVQGDQVPWRDTCHGRLARTLDGAVRVYSFGVNGAPLSQYLAQADHARDFYRPDALVMPIIENDFDQSLRWMTWPHRRARFFLFEEQADGELALAPPGAPVAPGLLQGLRRWVYRHSRLARYSAYHVGETLSRVDDEQRRSDASAAGTPDDPFRETDPAAAHADRVKASRRAVDAFFRILPERSGLDPDQIVFVVDGIRPYRYTEGWEHRWDGSYHDVMRRYFMDGARAQGYEVIDMQPVFVDHYRAHGQAFNWLRDTHWNALAHGLCAQQVARSVALRGVEAGTSAAATE